MNTVTEGLESDFGKISSIEKRLQISLKDKSYTEQLTLLQKNGFTPDRFSATEYRWIKFSHKDNVQQCVVMKDTGLVSFGGRYIFEKIEGSRCGYTVLYEGNYYIYAYGPVLGNISAKDSPEMFLVRNVGSVHGGFGSIEDTKQAIFLLTVPSEIPDEPS